MLDLYDDQDNSLRCAIKDKNTAMRNISQIVGGETSDTSKPSPTGVASEGEVGDMSPTTLATPLKGLPVVSSYDNLFVNQQEDAVSGGLQTQQQRSRSVTVTSFLKPPTPLPVPQATAASTAAAALSSSAFPRPRSNSQGGSEPALDYSSDHSTFSEANRELHSSTPGSGPAHLVNPQNNIPPPTPAVDSTPFTSYPCTPNFDSCPPPTASRELEYRFYETKTVPPTSTVLGTSLASSSTEDNFSAPKRARVE